MERNLKVWRPVLALSIMIGALHLVCAVAAAQERREVRRASSSRPMLSREIPVGTRSQRSGTEGAQNLDEFRMFDGPSRSASKPHPRPAPVTSRTGREEEAPPRTQAEVVDRVSRVIAEASAILKADERAGAAAHSPAAEPEAPIATPSNGTGAAAEPRLVSARAPQEANYDELLRLNETPRAPAAKVGACRAASQRSQPFATFDRSERIDLLVFDPGDPAQTRKVRNLPPPQQQRAVPYRESAGDPSLVASDPLRMFVDSLGVRCLPSRVRTAGSTLWFYEGAAAFAPEGR